MNAIRQTQALNKRELENAVPPEASWHADYRDTAYIYIGGLPFDLSEGDIITIFSQYGEPVHVDLIRDKETGKSRGFAFLKYEDQRSTDLAVDNLTGATVLGRVLRVDHARYKKRDNEEEEDNVAKLMGETTDRNARVEDTDDERRHKKRRSSDSREDEARSRPLLKEERELQELMMNHDDEDPMKEYLIEEKKEEIARALERLDKEKKHSRIAVIGHYPGKSVPTETDHRQAEKNLTRRDRLCAPDPQYRERILKETIVDDHRDQIINGCCPSSSSSD
ncbi:RNA-binding protein Cwf29 [Aspergillus fumigatus]